MRILIVEDELGLQEALVDLLVGAGHEVEAVGDGLSAVERAIAEEFDLVLLDLMLPRLGGVEACGRIRERKPDLYVVMLTARGAEENKVEGLSAGADDYVTKPFGARELLARVEAFERRLKKRPSAGDRIEADGCELDLGLCRAARDENNITLTAREVEILRWLHRNQARAVTRSELLENVWGAPGDLQTRTVDMTIANLRRKIERDPAEPRIVVTVKGVGYAWGTP